ncbi:exocyst complex component EXO84C [Tanacetum coccineum]
MIQTTLNVDVEEDINTKSHELMLFGKSIIIKILGTGMDTQDTSPSVLLFFDKQRFIFNAGEGLQRFCTEHKIKLSKIDHIFLSHVCSETAGGLPGLILTLAGNGEEGISVNVWEPSDFNYLVDAMKSFIPNVAMVHSRCFGPSPKSDKFSLDNPGNFHDQLKLIDDEVVKITSILLQPENHGLKEDENTFKSSDISVLFVCELLEIRGKFDLEKVTTLRLKRGPKYRDLQEGKSVESDTMNITVHPNDVLGPSLPGPFVLLCESFSASSEKKSLIEEQLIQVIDQTLISVADLKMAVSGLLKLGKATLSNLVLSTISSTTKELGLMFGDDMVYNSRVVQWAERRIELFVRLVKENAPSSETVSALHSASVCVQASLNHCAALEPQGLRLSKVLLVLLQPYMDEVLELNFRRARKLVFDFFFLNNDIMPLSPHLASPLSTFAITSDGLLVDSGTRFIFKVKDDSLMELKEAVPFKAETDSQQLALLATAFTIAEELLLMVMSSIWSILNESKEAGGGVNDDIAPLMNKMIKVRGRVLITKENLMQGIQIWMLRVQGTSGANSRTSFCQAGEDDAGTLDRNVNLVEYLDCSLMMEEERLIDAAKLIIRELELNTVLSNEAREVLLDLGARLASLAKIVESKDEGDSGNEKLSGVMARLESISQKVASWEVGQSMIWDSGTDDGKDYLKMVDEVRRLVERFEGLNLSKDSEEYEILRKANDVLQTSMARVEEEFKHMLAHNRQNFEPERLSFRSTEDDSLDDSSRFSFGDESVDDSIQRDSISRGAEVYVMDLINPQVIPDLRNIADLMFDSNYGRECSQAFHVCLLTCECFPWIQMKTVSGMVVSTKPVNPLVAKSGEGDGWEEEV